MEIVTPAGPKNYLAMENAAAEERTKSTAVVERRSLFADKEQELA
jgi:hypothetical protein